MEVSRPVPAFQKMRPPPPAYRRRSPRLLSPSRTRVETDRKPRPAAARRSAFASAGSASEKRFPPAREARRGRRSAAASGALAAMGPSAVPRGPGCHAPSRHGPAGALPRDDVALLCPPRPVARTGEAAGLAVESGDPAVERRPGRRRCEARRLAAGEGPDTSAVMSRTSVRRERPARKKNAREDGSWGARTSSERAPRADAVCARRREERAPDSAPSVVSPSRRARGGGACLRGPRPRPSRRGCPS